MRRPEPKREIDPYADTDRAGTIARWMHLLARHRSAVPDDARERVVQPTFTRAVQGPGGRIAASIT